MSLLPDGALVVWKWDVDNGSDNEHRDEDENEENLEDEESQEEEKSSDLEDHRSHTVTFKCIGTRKEGEYQDTLRLISGLKPVQQVEVKLLPEPGNPYDSKAIAFVAVVNSKDRRIGYAVREVLDDLHLAICEKKILKVEFAWVKMMAAWPRSGLGFYCGINITKRGEWSPTVVKHQSTR